MSGAAGWDHPGPCAQLMTDTDHCRPGRAQRSCTSDPVVCLRSKPYTPSVYADQICFKVSPEPVCFLRQVNTHLTALSSIGLSFLLMDRLKASDEELLVFSFLNKEMEKKRGLERETLNVELHLRCVDFIFTFSICSCSKLMTFR